MIAFGLEETVPEPVPPLFRVRVAVGLRANLALTDFALSIVTTQLPSGSDSQPLQPVNSEPKAGTSFRVTVLPALAPTGPW